MDTWAHLHLPRLQSGKTSDVISIKVPGQRIQYASWVSLENVTFRVYQPGRQRCIREGVRNVHAWVVGTEILRLTEAQWVGRFEDSGQPSGAWRRAVYDPWKGGTFVDSETLEPVLTADLVIMSGKNVYYAT